MNVQTHTHKHTHNNIPKLTNTHTNTHTHTCIKKALLDGVIVSKYEYIVHKTDEYMQRRKKQTVGKRTK